MFQKLKINKALIFPPRLDKHSQLISLREEINFTSLFVTTEYSWATLYHFQFMSCLITPLSFVDSCPRYTRPTKVTYLTEIIIQIIKVTHVYYETFWQLNQKFCVQYSQTDGNPNFHTNSTQMGLKQKQPQYMLYLCTIKEKK